MASGLLIHDGYTLDFSLPAQGAYPALSGKYRPALPVKVHTSDMTVEEGTAFLDWLIPWALQEHGVEIQTPDEWKEAA